jgi:hypothetical protein
MKINVPNGTKLPEPIYKKLEAALSTAGKLVDAADALRITKIGGSIQFSYESSVPRDILTPLERAQSLSFITRYDHLPVIDEISLEYRNGRFYLGSLHPIRHALTEYRPILMNKKDSTHFQNVGATIRQKLLNEDSSKDLRIKVLHEKDGDISKQFALVLKERIKGIAEIVRTSDFDYLYNGILQHSDPRFTDRFWKEYYDGSLNYVYITHAAILEYVKDSLYWHHTILNALTFPKLGAL